MNSSVEHIISLNSLAEFCTSAGLKIYEHEYNFMAFGSWVLVVGKDKHRLKFIWDGKDFMLSILKSDFQNSNSAPSWEPVFTNNANIEASKTFAILIDELKKEYVI